MSDLLVRPFTERSTLHRSLVKARRADGISGRAGHQASSSKASVIRRTSSRRLLVTRLRATYT